MEYQEHHAHEEEHRPHKDIKEFKAKNKGLFKALVIVLIFLFAGLFVSALVDIQNKIKQGRYIGQEAAVRNTITVSDSGEIFAKPDLALTSFSVVTEAKIISEAMQENTEKMNSVIEKIKEQGVKDKDLKTTSFRINPRYEYHEKAGIPPYPAGARVLVGYEVQQSLQVKIRDMDKIGQIIEQAVESGANQAGGLSFSIDNQDELKKQAREEAVKKAKNKAKELARQLGVDLVRITNFNENISTPGFYYDYGMGGGFKEAALAPNIETGEESIKVNITITYEIH